MQRRGSQLGLHHEASAGFGTAVAGAGDVDFDGFDDVLIGAPRAENDDVKPNFPVLAMTAHAAVSSASVETRPPCMMPTGP